LFGWGSDIFGIENLHISWRPDRNWRFILFVDNKPVSHVAVLGHTIRVADHTFVIGGVGGVVTIPSAQRHGYAKLLHEHVQQFLRDELFADFGLLFCRGLLVENYEQRGWQLLPNRVVINQPAGPIDAPLNVMMYSCQGEMFPSSTVFLNSLPW